MLSIYKTEIWKKKLKKSSQNINFWGPRIHLNQHGSTNGPHAWTSVMIMYQKHLGSPQSEADGWGTLLVSRSYFTLVRFVHGPTFGRVQECGPDDCCLPFNFRGIFLSQKTLEFSRHFIHPTLVRCLMSSSQEASLLITEPRYLNLLLTINISSPI